MEPKAGLSVYPPKQRRAARVAKTIRTATMYKAYFIKRLLEAMNLAEQAENDQERSIHLRASRYYRDLIENHHRRD